MSLLDTLRKNLTPEQFAAVQDALGDDFNYDMVPRSRLNAVIKQRDEARRQLSNPGSQPGEDGDDGAGDGAGSGGSGKALVITQADIDAAVQAEKDKHATAIATMHKRFAASEKLREANFVDPDLVLQAGLIDLGKVTLDENNRVTGGLEDQINTLAQSKPYMINGNGSGQKGTGKDGGNNGFGSVTSKEEFLKLPSDKQIEFKKANPEVFKGFMNS